MGRVAEYGRGHHNFLKYVERIVTNPVYQGMPDVRLDNGEIQWEAPSNRPGGKFQRTYERRLEWWKIRAREIGVDPDTTAEWISRTAKAIHPFGKKPCKKCGLELDIRYAYPNATLVKRILKLPYVDPAALRITPTDHILDLMARLHELYGDRVLIDLPDVLEAKGIAIPPLPASLSVWLRWIDEDYIGREPSVLSPGVMSNAPDRLDGFHSFNRCCRHSADTGRSKSNLQSYSTDRRAFEFWVDGDWIAADRLMGIMRADSALQLEACRHGHAGPCNADHVGPISLGFNHRAEFQLLCSSCNSSKNNRITLADVDYLRRVEASGEQVVSWYATEIWKRLSPRIRSREDASRLAKMLRDNRHTAMVVLDRIACHGHLAFLCSLLGLQYAEADVSYQAVEVDDHFVRFVGLKKAKRETRYVQEQKARRVRIAFAALNAYVKKQDRNALFSLPPAGINKLEALLALLGTRTPANIQLLNEELGLALAQSSDEPLRRLVDLLPSSLGEGEPFKGARILLQETMDAAAVVLEGEWTSDRYSRHRG